jgi:hypothetical protein
MSTMVITRGFALEVRWTILSAPGVPADLSDYDAVACDFDDAKGAVDKLTKHATILQNGTLNKGLVGFSFDPADTETWEGDVRIRHCWRLRHRDTQRWYACEGPEPVVVRDRIPDSL